jgi:hypothetical protein
MPMEKLNLHDSMNGGRRWWASVQANDFMFGLFRYGIRKLVEQKIPYGFILPFVTWRVDASSRSYFKGETMKTG